MALPNNLVGGAGVNLVCNLELVVLWGIGASGHPVVVGAGGNSHHIAVDHFIEIYINYLFAEVVFD